MSGALRTAFGNYAAQALPSVLTLAKAGCLWRSPEPFSDDAAHLACMVGTGKPVEIKALFNGTLNARRTTHLRDKMLRA